MDSTTVTCSASSSVATIDDEYIEGSIVRIALTHFVTYDSVEFCPGPNLNMIIGPNGTGKSTIVCAIALGLGGHPSILGRAREISDYVKHGEDRAEIEIELKSSPNLIIKRHIKKENNSSTWRINGEPATQKEVLARVGALNIQVNNLCQFLPQDKVSEFAQMNPPELLVETQRAVGDAQLGQWHESLKKLRNEEKDLALSAKGDSEQVENLEKRNQVLERDVTRFRERESIMRRVRLLELRIPFARYAAAKDEYDRAKREREAAHLNYKRIEEEHGPATRAKTSIERNAQSALQSRRDNQDALRVKTTEIDRIVQRLEQLEGDGDDARRAVSEAKHKEKQRQNRIAGLRNEIQQLEAVVAGPPPECNTEEIQRQLDAVNNRLRQISEDMAAIQAQQEDESDEQKIVMRQYRSCSEQRQALANVKERRLESLRESDSDMYNAVHWLRRNQNRFVKPVYEPIYLEINVKEKKYIDAVEAVAGQAILKTFVCQTAEDYKLFTGEVIDSQRLRVNAICCVDKVLENFKPPVPLREMKQRYGMECYLLQQVEGPNPVLTVLCSEANFHAVPYAAKEIDHESFVQSVRSFRAFTYICGDMQYRVGFSQYGKKLPQSNTFRMRPGRFLTDSRNMQRMHELDAQLNSLRERREKIEAAMQRLKREEDTFRAEDEELREKKHQLTEEKRQLMKERTDYERAKVKLQARQQSLDDELGRPNYLTQAESQFRTVIQDFGRRRCRLVKDYQVALQEILRLFKEKTGAAFKHMQAQAELVALARRVAERDDALREARTKFNDAERKFNAAKDRARQLLDEAKAGTDNLDEQTRQEFQDVGRDMTLEELEDALVSERAKAELYFSISPHIVQQYNQRKAEIDALKEKLSGKESRLAELSTEMTTIRDKWESKLNEIVKNISAKFSAAFDKIGCAGEVRVSTHEDYDKWGIDILVKFRDHEKLQVLTGQRQSGGERSVSTIMYLMSLQELAKAPFRVVDEINQGMDPRNERMVHSQMVQAACRPNTSQYFLITPKLLPDLEYNERMKILCIYNGEWLPNKFDWQKYIKNKQRSGNEAKGKKRKAEV